MKKSDQNLTDLIKSLWVKLLKLAGEILVNFALEKLGVDPYVTKLIPDGEGTPVFRTDVFKPHIFMVEHISRNEYQLTEKILREMLAQNLADLVGVQKAFEIRESPVDDKRTLYTGFIAILPPEYVETTMELQ